MHEMSLAEGMLQMIEQQVGGIEPMERATVTVGTLSGVCADSLKFAFTEIAGEMGFGRPELCVIVDMAQATCLECGCIYDMPDAFALCPECDSLNREIGGGEELLLGSVEMKA